METATNQFLLLGSAFNGWELVLILAVVLILFGAKRLPKLSAGMRNGLFHFRKATEEVAEELLQEKESGLVYEAFTTDNRTSEFAYPERRQPPVVQQLILFLAQGFGVGRIPFAPDLFGSLLGLGWCVLLLQTGNCWYYLGGMMAGVAVAVLVCGAAHKTLQDVDARTVVLDKIVAMPICFLPWVAQLAWLGSGTFSPFATLVSSGRVLAAIAALLLFRLVAIIEPWPIRRAQLMGGSWGIVLDDVLAAAYVAALLTPLLVG
jgi:phosphatidylglycerophosphatase A